MMDVTPMGIACLADGYLDIMTWLYDHGGKDDVTKANNDGKTPMWIACHECI